MADLDTLRPGVQQALAWLKSGVRPGTRSFDGWSVIRAELVRLAEYEQAAGRLAVEKAEFRQRAEQYEAELAAAQNTIAAQQGTMGALKRKLALAEGELAALKAKIAEAPIAPVCESPSGDGVAYWIPRALIGKRVRLVVED